MQLVSRKMNHTFLQMFYIFNNGSFLDNVNSLLKILPVILLIILKVNKSKNTIFLNMRIVQHTMLSSLNMRTLNTLTTRQTTKIGSMYIQIYQYISPNTPTLSLFLLFVGKLLTLDGDVSSFCGRFPVSLIN